jgi:hypothetical protein
MLWMALLVLLVIAVVGGIAISKFLFLVLVVALLVALFARKSFSHCGPRPQSSHPHTEVSRWASPQVSY